MSFYYLLFYASWIVSMIGTVYVSIGYGRALGWGSISVLLILLGAPGAFLPVLGVLGAEGELLGFDMNSPVQQVAIARVLSGVTSLGLILGFVRMRKLETHFAEALFYTGLLCVGLVHFWCFLVTHSP